MGHIHYHGYYHGVLNVVRFLLTDPVNSNRRRITGDELFIIAIEVFIACGKTSFRIIVSEIQLSAFIFETVQWFPVRAISLNYGRIIVVSLIKELQVKGEKRDTICHVVKYIQNRKYILARWMLCNIFWTLSNPKKNMPVLKLNYFKKIKDASIITWSIMVLQNSKKKCLRKLN